VTGNRGQAQELTQETFLRAYRTLLRGEVWENPRAWLYRTASRLAIDLHRRQRLLQQLPLSTGAATPEVETATLDSIEVRTALDTLPLKYRIPLLLYVCEGYSVAEVANILGLSPGAVKMRLCRARGMFRQAYGPEEGR
jgi:RNA polymerase sigma-70 factor (ECF subfamily)